jgi:hypothetical protein
LLIDAISAVLPAGALHQGCLWHAKELLEGMIEYKPTERKYKQLQKKIRRWQEEMVDHKPHYDTRPLEMAQEELQRVEAVYGEKQALLTAIMCMLYRPRRHSSAVRFWHLKQRYGKRYPQPLAWIEAKWEMLLAHQRDPRLAKTNAQAENFNKQLKRRFKTIEAFQHLETAGMYLNLLSGYLRCKPYTDCRRERKLRNGKSPLDLCEVHLPHHEWIRSLLRKA